MTLLRLSLRLLLSSMVFAVVFMSKYFFLFFYIFIFFFLFIYFYFFNCILFLFPLFYYIFNYFFLILILLFFIIRCAKALDRGAAHLCILSQDCDNDEYTRLIKALCAESKVPIIMADSGTDIGEWVGLAKLNPDGTVRKAVRCSVAVVTDFGSESQALTNVLEYVKNNA